ncbi:MAG: hypothetical protein ACFE75_00415 [Candidatus Hodarchaeota archaeon]
MGTSPFFGAPTFGARGLAFQEKFMNKAATILEVEEAQVSTKIVLNALQK